MVLHEEEVFPIDNGILCNSMVGHVSSCFLSHVTATSDAAVPVLPSAHSHRTRAVRLLPTRTFSLAKLPPSLGLTHVNCYLLIALYLIISLHLIFL